MRKICLEDSGGGKNSLAPTTKITRSCQRPHSLYIATYNARTLSSDEKLLELEEELKNIKWDILGISEARRIGEGQVILKSGNTLCYSGEETAIRGVGILVHKKYKDMIVDVKNISPRVICLTIKLNKKYSVKVIQAYAPTTESTDDELENFYEDVSTALQNGKTHYTMLIGDFNAKVGSKQDEAETSVSYHGLGSRNERGDTLIDFAHHNKLYT
ncbi:craniofacial development protein 2-like [Sitophilus oryzae]|uniref:Craniofacial development protein 2-like n=1 Tax=Sitophilus oryzae TaxID=7048 RepID=A0A6J2X7H1_SITOR|nr:craniofacial development protein 2-like [Sitophilus oryzae]